MKELLKSVYGLLLSGRFDVKGQESGMLQQTISKFGQFAQKVLDGDLIITEKEAEDEPEEDSVPSDSS